MSPSMGPIIRFKHLAFRPNGVELRSPALRSTGWGTDRDYVGKIRGITALPFLR